MENLVSLCRVHHRAVHEDAFRAVAHWDEASARYESESWIPDPLLFRALEASEGG